MSYMYVRRFYYFIIISFLSFVLLFVGFLIIIIIYLLFVPFFSLLGIHYLPSTNKRKRLSSVFVRAAIVIC